MHLIDHYTALRLLHITMVVCSGSLFALRGLGVLARAQWPLQAGWRWLSYGIDTLLLGAALSLLWALQLNPFATPWLQLKLGLLLLYIVLGSLALKRARTRAGRGISFLAALLCFAFMATVARAHSPWGIWSL